MRRRRRWKPKRRRVPKEFQAAVAAGTFDYDSHQNIDENRQRAQDDGVLGFEDDSDDTLYVDWKAKGAEYGRNHANAQWEIGDWLNAGFELRSISDRDRHPIYGMAAEVTGLSIPTLRVYKHVAHCVNSNIRDYSLSFSKHQMIASLSEEQQRQALSGLQHKTDKMAREWLEMPATRVLLKLDEPKVNADQSKPKNPKPKSSAADIRNSRAMIRLCDQLLESLSEYRPVARTPAGAMWTLREVAAVALDVADKIEAAWIPADASR
jgi:hypothetical protein